MTKINFSENLTSTEILYLSLEGIDADEAMKDRERMARDVKRLEDKLQDAYDHGYDEHD